MMNYCSVPAVTASPGGDWLAAHVLSARLACRCIEVRGDGGGGEHVANDLPDFYMIAFQLGEYY